MNLAIVVAAAIQLAATPPPPVPSLAAAAEAAATPPRPASTATMPKNTMIRLMVLNEVNSRDHKAGHRFKLRVDEDVVVGGVRVVPTGAFAFGEVTSAEGTGGVGKSGRLGARLLYLDMGGKRVALAGERQTAGTGGTGQAIAGVVALGVFGLFMKGNNATIKAGEIINGYTLEDVAFDPLPTPLQ